MKLPCLAVALLAVALLAPTADAQNRPPNTIGAQGPSVTVQLPTFHVFGVSTTVLVPDRGAAYLGGITRGSDLLTTAGVPLLPGGNQGLGSTRGASTMSVSAWIHDFEEMDRAILAQAAVRRGGLGADGQSFDLPPAVVRHDHRDLRVPAASVAKLRQQHADRQEQVQNEAQRHFDKAESLVAEGKPGVARVYYQMALRRAEGELKTLVTARLAGLSKERLAQQK